MSDYRLRAPYRKDWTVSQGVAHWMDVLLYVHATGSLVDFMASGVAVCLLLFFVVLSWRCLSVIVRIEMNTIYIQACVLEELLDRTSAAVAWTMAKLSLRP